MLKVTDVLELKKRTKPQECNYTRMRGCYVNNDKDKVTELNERFLSLPEEEYYKYLEIASQTLSKKVEDNMLSISLQAGEEDGTIKYLLKRAIASGLQDDETMEQLYDIIISTFNYVGNYLILFYYEAYDVPRVATDGEELEDSEDVYKYVLCSVLPVSLTAAGLEYNTKSNRIQSKERDWVVRKPYMGFIYPSFEERTAEEDKFMFYTATPDEAPHDFMELGLRTNAVRTATEVRIAFERIFFDATQSKELQDDYVVRVNELLDIKLTEAMDPEMRLYGDELESILKQAEIPEPYLTKILTGYRNEFREYPKLEWIRNKRAVKKSVEQNRKKTIRELMLEAADSIEKAEGEETDLTSKMKHAAEKMR